MFETKKQITYLNEVEGTWGEFNTPAGRVAFIMTKARLGTKGTDKERRLTAQLRPVREVLEPQKLNFNQLLQRDLDDHRVSTALIPYLLTPATTGPAFFPPIMAVLLPFHANRPTDFFPKTKPPEIVITSEKLRMRQIQAGEAYCSQILVDDEDSPHSIKLGRLAWNDEEAKLVVLDGQHRAMALIAIDRTLNRTWEQESGARYRHFYERRINTLLEEAERRGAPINLEQVEIPVTVCWFPDLTELGHSPHTAARKIFVDVNKEARTPSEARLILLSDKELQDIFTRSLLNRLREPEPPMPLSAIEYDNPNKDSARPVRWSVLTHINLLKVAVQHTLFCPSKYLNDMSKTFGGRLPENEMDIRMRQQLDILNIFPERIEDDERSIERSNISNLIFPLKQVDKLTDKFMESWGDAILTILGKLEPYKAHCEALTELKDSWAIDDAMSGLAHDALFVGVGMYWTLKASYETYAEEVTVCTRDKKTPPTKPDIVKAWEIIADSKHRDFKALRAKAYLGKSTEQAVVNSEAVYQVMNTQACQLGAILALVALVDLKGLKGKEIAAFAVELVAAWNKALKGHVTQDRDRRLFFARESTSVKYPLNQTGKMDTPMAVYFRYFWLELYLSEKEDAQVEKLTNDALIPYLAYLVNEQFKALKKNRPSATFSKEEDKLKKDELKKINKALTHWIGKNRVISEDAISKAVSVDNDEDDKPENTTVADAPTEPSLDELLNDLD